MPIATSEVRATEKRELLEFSAPRNGQALRVLDYKSAAGHSWDHVAIFDDYVSNASQ